jgi:hypothetical protein
MQDSSGNNIAKLGGGGGFNGGGSGGNGVDGGGGGGGGGMSSVLRGNLILVAAGGGGGGGSTDYCCAHGGGGGGSTASTGSASLLETPVHIGEDASADSHVRSEYSGKDESLEPNPEIDPRDISGMPAHHSHIDRGFAPNASYSILATGGTGGSLDSASHYGFPGISGSYKVNLVGELNFLSQSEGTVSVPTITDSAFSKYALPGLISKVAGVVTARREEEAVEADRVSTVLAAAAAAAISTTLPYSTPTRKLSPVEATEDKVPMFQRRLTSTMSGTSRLKCNGRIRCRSVVMFQASMCSLMTLSSQ